MGHYRGYHIEVSAPSGAVVIRYKGSVVDRADSIDDAYAKVDARISKEKKDG